MVKNLIDLANQIKSSWPYIEVMIVNDFVAIKLPYEWWHGNWFKIFKKSILKDFPNYECIKFFDVQYRLTPTDVLFEPLENQY